MGTIETSLISIQEACEILQVSVATCHRKINSGDIEYATIGKRKLPTRASVEAFKIKREKEKAGD